MAIQRPIDSQARARELGVVRIGEKRRNAQGKTFPSMRETFRITSPQRAILEAVQAVYPGELREWPKSDKEREWELLTQTNELRVFLIPNRCMTEHMERWSNGGCTHRCDMVDVDTWDKDQPVTRPCMCDPENPICKLTTRLQFGLSNVPLLGIWRLNSLGKIFSGELRAELDQMAAVGLSDKPVYCILNVRQEEIKKPGQPARKFAIPGITIDPNPPDFPAMLSGMTIAGRLEMQQRTAPQIEAPVTAQARRIEAPAAARRVDEPDDDDDAIEGEFTASGATLQPVRPAAAAAPPQNTPARTGRPQAQFELPARPTSSLPVETIKAAAAPNGWLQCPDCDFTVAEITFTSGLKARYNADGRRHETTCGQRKPSGWDEQEAPR